MVRLDCAGDPQPGLARSWSSDQNGTLWRFQLDSTGYGDLTASAVVGAFDARRNGGLWPWPHILDMRASAPFTLEVQLDSSFSRLPVALAAPALALHVGPFREDITARPRSGPLVELRMLVPANSRTARPQIRLQQFQRGLDERDMLDLPPIGLIRPVDVLITRDLITLEYARSKPGFRTVELPWDRTYVLVTPLQVDSSLASDTRFLHSLARDAVTSEARPSEGSFWWGRELACHGTMPIMPMGRLQQVVYPRDDAPARELAERLVATRFPTYRTVGLLPDPLAASLAGGDAAAYVIPLPRLAPAACGSIPQWPSAATVIPLVESRARAIVRSGTPSFEIDGDGMIRFVPTP